jgi:mono/diheme cytochrome c family protein
MVHRKKIGNCLFVKSEIKLYHFFGDVMKLLITIVMVTLSFNLFAERNKSEMEPLPNYIKGLDWNGKVLRHGYIRWIEKKPYSPEANPALVNKGKAIYAKHCMECHGETGKGDGPVAKKYGVKVASISKSRKTLNNHTIFVQIAEGRADMPMWMDLLTEEEIWSLTHYLHTLK